MVTIAASSTEKLVQGLRPGRLYAVSLKVFQFMYMVCSDQKESYTVPATSQLVVSRGISSTTIRLEWSNAIGATSYEVVVQQRTNSQNIRTITATSLSALIDGLQPDTQYDCFVRSSNAAGLGGKSILRTVSTPINSVTTVSATYSCSSGAATVTWDQVSGAGSYRASARAGDGTLQTCNSTSTSCEITMLKCGQVYVISVTAISDYCESTSNQTDSFETAPCPPVGVWTYLECGSNAIMFSWNATNNTNYYEGLSQNSDGSSVPCRTTDTSCFFASTSCGQNYTFTVRSVSGTCRTDYSVPIHQQTAPCLPENVKTQGDCNSGMLISMWDPTPGAVSHTVEARGNRGDAYNCTSQTNNCTMPAVPCGEVLSIYITASNSECDTDQVIGEPAQTAPCTPTNFTLVESCDAPSVSLDWESSKGAIFYIAKAVDSNGTTQGQCLTFAPECDIIDLSCDTTYETYVFATNIICNSSETRRATFTTAPCPPSSVQAIRGCADNDALVMWQDSLVGGTYTAVMEDHEGRQVNCSTPNNNCTISELACGQNYSVTVRRYNGTCTGPPSSPVYMDSVPCVPEYLHGDVNCDTGAITVGWNVTSSLSSQTYTTMVSRGTEQLATCNSTETQCTVQGLECGLYYNITVQAVQDSCHSLSSHVLSIDQVPCVPTAVNAAPTCGDSSIAVTWAATPGDLSYRAQATTTTGHSSHCTSQYSTSCSIPNLLCGREYNVSVSASNSDCSSLPSPVVIVKTAPCPPVNIQGSVNCSSGEASLTWDAVPNVVLYNGTAVSADGHVVSCNSSQAGCKLCGLHCGTYYNFSVSATDGTCASPPSAPHKLDSAPCTPSIISASLDCYTQVAVVTFHQQGQQGVTYMANATNSQGHVVSTCTSDSNNCSLSNLPCGPQYNVTVTATAHGCSSAPSPPHVISQDFCMANVTQVDILCQSDSALVMWKALLAGEFTATAECNDGNRLNCSSSNTSCEISNLRCGQLYTFSVAGPHCPPGNTLQKYSVPCVPVGVSVEVNCSENSAIVSWDRSQGALSYQTFAQSSYVNISCQSSDLSCTLTNVTCGANYSVQVVAKDTKCSSTPSLPHMFQSVPCVPVGVSVEVNCSKNSAIVSWDRSQGALSYQTFAQSSYGNISCQSSDLSCTLTNVTCGANYSVQVVAKDTKCSSTPSLPHMFQSVPCVPVGVSVEVNCSENSAIVSWDRSEGALSYQAFAQSSYGNISCHSSDLSCTLTNVTCGANYSVRVVAKDTKCSSTPSLPHMFQSAPCAPTDVTVTPACASGSASIGWSPANGALSYLLIMETTNGDPLFCMTGSTSCAISGLQCGQEYQVFVTAIGNSCNSTSAPDTFWTAPCTPSIISASLDCYTQVAVVTWHQQGQQGVTYMANATNSQGHVVSTCTSDSNNCSLSDLPCGPQYNVTVTATAHGCSSAPSPPHVISQDFCMANVTQVDILCQSDSALVMWKALLAGEFTASAECSDGNSLNCSSSNTSCEISNLRCGQLYTFSVAGPHCPPGNTLQKYSEPCAPTNVSSSIDCLSNIAAVSWDGSSGTEYYTAVLQDSDGVKRDCMSSSNNCSIVIRDCGQNYSVSVTASNGQCNTTATGSTLVGVPCVPVGVSVEVNCSENSAIVSWDRSQGALSYQAFAQSSYGNISCHSSELSCTLTNVTCGANYSVRVVAKDTKCSSTPSLPHMFQSAPCAPTDVTVTPACVSGSASIGWSPANGALSYLLIMETTNGDPLFCMTGSTSCYISGLQCGQEYQVFVTAIGNSCNSTSAPDTFWTVPCVPVGVSVEVNCSKNSAIVSWDRSQGALSYQAFAQSSYGNISCQSSDLSCTLTNVTCGANYSVQVVAMDSKCSSTPSLPHMFQSVPCVPVGVSVEVNCSENSAIVSWDRSEGALSYQAFAQSSYGNISCHSSDLSCTLTNVTCGANYSVRVVAKDTKCSSTPSLPHMFQSAPCAPTDVTVTPACASGSASIGWSPANGALSYLLIMETTNGDPLFCMTGSTSCAISGLQCGQEYQVFVTAIGNSCNSTSAPDTFWTAPCTPSIISASLDCYTQVAVVTWHQQGQQGVTYMANATNSQGHVVSTCTSDSNNCSLSNLPCGPQYNVTVTATAHGCSSAPSPPHVISQDFCMANVTQVDILCQSDSALVMWKALLAGEFTASAECSDGNSLNCSSSNTSCEISNLRCGQLYTFSVAGPHCPPGNTLQKYSEPCAPTNVSSSIDCLSNIAAVSWDGSSGTEYYTAVLQDSDGVKRDCMSSSNNCSIVIRDCGQNYSVSVTASNGQCNTTATGSTLVGVPCVPVGVSVEVNCSENSAIVSWDRSQGALSYQAFAQSSYGNISCHSSDLSCTLTNVTCGANYSVRVVAKDTKCSSTPSLPHMFQSAPCAPTDVTVTPACASGSASIGWSPANGALSYLLIMETTNGDPLFCMTGSTSCAISGLQCGQEYQVFVTAIGNSCNSTSAPDTFWTAPCTPSIISASLDCYTQVAAVTWHQQGQQGVTYMANATNSQGHVVSTCTSDSNNCSLSNLSCGPQYNVTVTATAHGCSSAPSPPHVISQDFCMANVTQVDILCQSDSALVMWKALLAGEFTASAECSDGNSLNCSSSNTSCEISNLRCGQLYTFSVAGPHCPPGNTLQKYSEPCAPTNVSSSIDCLSNIAAVSWDGSSGTEYYTAVLQDSDGVKRDCMSSSNNCSIDIQDCGQNYSVSVTASNGQCNTTATGSTLVGVPCVPVGVSVEVNCSENSAIVSWDRSQGALSYQAFAQSSYGNISCHSSDLSCTLTNVTCGANYSVRVVAKDTKCSSTPSLPHMFQSAPCAPTDVTVTPACVSGSASIGWSPTNGALSYLVIMETTNGDPLFCMTGSTSCAISGLQCGQEYQVFVTAIGNSCNSTSAPDTFWTVPCVPVGVSVEVNCSKNSAIVSWDRSQGALSYQAFAQSSYGNISCQSSDLSCTLTNVTCGANYSVQVVAMDTKCSSTPSLPHMFQSVPCVPVGVSVEVNCSENSAIVSWDRSQGALSYQAFAQSSYGNISCHSSDLSCTLTNVTCGANYSVRVVAKDTKCSSTPSLPHMFQSAPCAPTDVTVTPACVSGSASIGWSPTNGALSYLVIMETTNGDPLFCMTGSTSCAISGLQCGQEYQVFVTAIGNSCNSTSAPDTFWTAPCTPSIISASLDCYTQVAVVTWHQQGQQGVTYMANATNSQGHVVSTCTSDSNNCSLSNLSCGPQYNVTVTATAHGCSSAPSPPHVISQDSCTANVTQVDILCQSDSALVMWQASGISEFTATAEDGDGNSLNCSSSNTSCEISNLRCGQLYTFSVARPHCLPGNTLQKYSEPCAPTNVSSSIDCLSNIAAVSWDGSSGTEYYTAVLQDSDGVKRDCMSSSNNCSIDIQDCGQNYSVSVTASNGQCNTTATGSTLVGVPCVPVGVSVEVNCSKNSAIVSWDRSEGALSYQAFAQSSYGNISCHSSDLSCTLTNVTCGTNYSVRVVAKDTKCSSTPSLPHMFQSAPCAPTNVTVTPACASGSASIRWSSAAGALSYLVTMETTNGDPLFCMTGSTSCAISGLQCGQEYQVFVTAIGNSCNSTSAPDTFWTVPCVPVGVSVEVNCSENSAIVSWDRSQGALSYQAFAQSSYGNISCHSSDLSCTLTNVTCGANYSIRVVAKDTKCSSTPSLPHMFQSAPCAPTNVTVTPACASGSASIRWSSAAGALSYLVTMETTNGDPLFCMTGSTSCAISGLQCGQEYQVFVTAIGNSCNSTSAPDTFWTGLCAPVNLSLSVDCGNSSGVLSWGASAGAVRYTGCGQAANGSSIQCNTTELWCVVEGLVCGLEYNFTVQASDDQCTSPSSQPLAGGQVPCAPEGLQVRLLPAQHDRQVLRSMWDRVDCPGAQYQVKIIGSIQGDADTQFELFSYWTERDYFELPIPCSSTYSVTVRARGSAGGEGPASAAITGITVTYTGSEVSAVVSWNSSVFATYYSVYDVSGSGGAQICNTTELSCNVTGVSSDDIAVTASNSAGQSSETNVTNGVSLSPELSVTRVGTDSVRVEWTPVPGASYYTLRVREKLNARPLWSNVASVYDEVSDVTGLKPATSYCFSVSAVMSTFSSSAYSEPACATTGASI
ncbi:hypothetical protein ACEWY4_006285 [Coilia grayii]|uniref:Fibronectin type-III domain-containing protein n=1 Tax=Coilia grayii TaxID=363190 RepID=A0ABD1KD89_9TELE